MRPPLLRDHTLRILQDGLSIGGPLYAKMLLVRYHLWEITPFCTPVRWERPSVNIWGTVRSTPEAKLPKNPVHRRHIAVLKKLSTKPLTPELAEESYMSVGIGSKFCIFMSPVKYKFFKIVTWILYVWYNNFLKVLWVKIPVCHV